MVKNQFKLRAHHGMCLAFFEGKGYSKDFTEHMQAVYDAMKDNPRLKIAAKEDVICQKCPNLQKGSCKTQKLVQEYDRKVLSHCGIHEDTEISWAEFSTLVKKNILAPGRRKSICGNCQWSKICESKEQAISESIQSLT